MSDLFRYINIRFLMNLIICLFAILLISFLIDTIESSKTITQMNVSSLAVLSLLYNKFIVLTVQTFPLAVYISLVILLFRLHIKNEYLALLTSALNPWRLLAFLLPLLILLGIINFIILDRVMPPASKNVDRLLVNEFKRFTASWTYFYRDRNWFLSVDRSRLYHYSDIDEDKRIIKSFEIYKFSQVGFEEIITADFVTCINNNVFKARKLERYSFGKDDSAGYESMDESILKLPDEFDNFRQRRGRPYQMSFISLLELINFRERVGLDISRYKYELYMKVINPVSLVLICVFLLIFFIRYLYLLRPVYLIIYSLLILMFYIISVIFSGKLSESSIGQPFVAAILPVVLLVSISTILMRFSSQRYS